MALETNINSMIEELTAACALKSIREYGRIMEQLPRHMNEAWKVMLITESRDGQMFIEHEEADNSTFRQALDKDHRRGGVAKVRRENFGSLDGTEILSTQNMGRRPANLLDMALKKLRSASEAIVNRKADSHSDPELKSIIRSVRTATSEIERAVSLLTAMGKFMKNGNLRKLARYINEGLHGGQDVLRVIDNGLQRENNNNHPIAVILHDPYEIPEFSMIRSFAVRHPLN
jgi:hypothetical protein